jgi:hypothetical protein
VIFSLVIRENIQGKFCGIVKNPGNEFRRQDASQRSNRWGRDRDNSRRFFDENGAMHEIDMTITDISKFYL